MYLKIIFLHPYNNRYHNRGFGSFLEQETRDVFGDGIASVVEVDWVRANSN